MHRLGLVLLAAGPSTRLGQPKQLLVFRGKSLLNNMLQAAAESVDDGIVVVLGANAEAIRQQIDNLSVLPVENPAWDEGIASSIRCGLSALLASNSQINNVIFMVCDQPFVTGSLLKKLISKRVSSGKPIIACIYKKTAGTPALFHEAFFPELMSLKGHEGAKKIIMNHISSLATISFPMGSIDIDTAADFEALKGDGPPGK